MALTVFFPITDAGFVSSTLGSLAAREKRASVEMPIPGAMAPPIYSPLSLMAQNVVAVPKSTIISGPPYFSIAATALTIRSAPTSLGFSYFIERPVFIPGPTTSGFSLKYLLHTLSRVNVSGGTTVEITTALTRLISFPEKENSSLSSIQYSSAVRCRFVERRQFPTSSLPSKTPRTILVFPTSKTRITAIPAFLYHFYPFYQGDRQGATRIPNCCKLFSIKKP